MGQYTAVRQTFSEMEKGCFFVEKLSNIKFETGGKR